MFSMKTTAAANASNAETATKRDHWKVAASRRSEELADMAIEDCWVAWVTVSTTIPGLHGRDTRAMSWSSREDAIAGACEFMTEARPYVYGVVIWRLDLNNQHLNERVEIRRRKMDKLADMIRRTAALATSAAA